MLELYVGSVIFAALTMVASFVLRELGYNGSKSKEDMVEGLNSTLDSMEELSYDNREEIRHAIDIILLYKNISRVIVCILPVINVMVFVVGVYSIVDRISKGKVN